MSDTEPIAGEPIAGELVVPTHSGGFMVLRSAPDDALAAWLSDVRDHEAELRDAKRLVADEIHRRMDAQAEWTLIGVHWKISSRSPAPREVYDAETLRRRLMQWAASADTDVAKARLRAVEKAVTSTTAWVTRQAGINALKKLGDPEVTAALDATRQELEASRPIKLELT
jgi:hypothetical protein